jgi:predicted Ser/Thr protein kinase
MDYTFLTTYTFQELKKMAKDMDLPSKRSKSDYLLEIKDAFKDYEYYKKKKMDKYTRIKRLGNKGCEGTIYLVVDKKNREFAMKTFKKTKSSNLLKIEYSLQKKVACSGISPRVVEYDSVSKYIVMEKMDTHLIDLIKKQKCHLTRNQQLQIIEIHKKLDDSRVFHGDFNIFNYMIKDKTIYIIDFGCSKEINYNLIKKLGTNKPNMKILTIGIVNKLKELMCSSSSWKYLKREISNDNID